ncbi:MAG: hypothetical protein SF052_14425 [Bacteroidia bacterium]|nr:hypothetical protein [Bacteroidia bacterium]
MRIPFLLIFALLFVLGSPACRQADTAEAETQTTESPATDDLAGRPVMTLFAVKVDKLRLRKEPGQTTEVVAYVNEGDFVTGMGEVSNFRDTMELRGIYYQEPYYKVITNQTQPATGYIFGGGLLPVYVGPAEKSPDLGRLTKFTAHLKSLPAADLASGEKAWTYVQEKLRDADPALADATYILLQNFMTKMEMDGLFYSLTEQIQWKDEDYEAVYREKYDMNANPITASLAKNGFSLATAEGMIFPVVNRQKLADFFLNKVSPSLKEYIQLDLEDFHKPSMSDGGLVIPLEEYATRAIAWEKFETAYPRFVMSSIVHEHAKWMGITLLGGVDNTPSYDYETEEVREDFEKAWAMILAKHPETRIAVQIREMQAIIAQSGGKYSDSALAYVQKLWETE